MIPYFQVVRYLLLNQSTVALYLVPYVNPRYVVINKVDSGILSHEPIIIGSSTNHVYIYVFTPEP